MIWANGAVSVLLALSMLVAWMTIFNAPHNRHLFTAASIISFICVTVIPILGVSMVVMEILSRRDRIRASIAADLRQNPPKACLLKACL